MPVTIPPAGADVLPAPDADFSLFATQFGGAFLPATFNVVVPLAATIIADAAAFVTALGLATDPTTRTTVTIAAKDASRVAASVNLRAAIRSAQAAFLAGLVTEAQLNNIGVRANSLIRSVIGDPAFAPQLDFVSSVLGMIRLRVSQVSQVTGLPVSTRAFSYGIIGVQAERSVSAGPWMHDVTVKRLNLLCPVSLLASGTAVRYRVRYFTARGQVSPWSSVISAVVQ